MCYVSLLSKWSSVESLHAVAEASSSLARIRSLCLEGFTKELTREPTFENGLLPILCKSPPPCLSSSLEIRKLTPHGLNLRHGDMVEEMLRDCE